MLSIVLARKDFKEYDQLVSLYTLEQGKVEALARSAKKILSKNSAQLEPFCLVEAEIIPGKDINHLGSVSPANIFKNIRADLRKSLMAGYAADLLSKVIHPGEPDSRIFRLTASWLEYLDAHRHSDPPAGGEGSVPSALLDAFVVKLFFFLGFDITKVKKMPVGVKKELAKILKEKWSEIKETKNTAALRRLIYRYAVYHSERKLGQWVYPVK